MEPAWLAQGAVLLLVFERSCWAAGDDGSVGLAVSEIGSAWLKSSELDVGKTDTSDNSVVVPGRNSGLGQRASDGRDS